MHTDSIIPFEQSFACHIRSKNWSSQNLIHPEYVLLNSYKKFWFNCFNCNHIFQSRCNDINRGSWCPYCSNPPKRLCNNNDCNTCFQKSFASHEKAVYWSSKNILTARQVLKNSNQKFLFNCIECAHEFQSGCNTINAGRWCKYCTNQELCNNNDCNTCFQKSFASHEKSLCWSSKNNLTARQVFKKSNKKFLFNCSDCKHEFKSRCCNIILGYWCPYCSNPPQKLCDNNDCNTCFQKSFASHEKSSCWSSKNNLTVRQVFKHSNQKFLFNCPKCAHEFQSSCNEIVFGHWCPYCSNPPQKLCDNNDCNTCFQKSFASHEKSSCWSSKNNLTARQVFKNSNKTILFNCSDCNNEFHSKCGNINLLGRWCSHCTNKTEAILFNKLKEQYLSVIHQFKADWCKKQHHLPFDFLLPEHNIIIELDGVQHFCQVSNWNPPEITQKTDKYKMKCANENGYSIIRLLQEDVLKNNFDWLNELTVTINKIITDNIIQIIYICKNHEYDIYL